MMSNWFLWILLLILFCSGCFVVSHNKFTLYKDNPLEKSEFKMKIQGFYFQEDSLSTGNIFLFNDGTCNVSLGTAVNWKVKPNELANRKIERIKEFAAWRIIGWGHYVITDNKINFELYEDFPGLAIRWNIVKSEGVITNSETIYINNNYCEWMKDSVCPHTEGKKYFSPPLKFKFHQYDLSELDSIHPFFVKKRWYQKNVWYNN